MRAPLRVMATAFFILLAAFGVAAQADADVCHIPVRIAPDIRGIQLGMQYEDVKRQFKNPIGFIWAPKPDEAGVIDSVDLSLLDWHEKAEAFKGVEAMSLVFTDGKVSGLAVLYSADTKWPSIQDFTAQISKTLALPPAWQDPTNADPKTARVMYCDGFRVIAVTGKGDKSFIGLVDTTAEQIVKERRAAIEERKRRAFKP